MCRINSPHAFTNHFCPFFTSFPRYPTQRFLDKELFYLPESLVVGDHRVLGVMPRPKWLARGGKISWERNDEPERGEVDWEELRLRYAQKDFQEEPEISSVGHFFGSIIKHHILVLCKAMFRVLLLRFVGFFVHFHKLI